MKIRWKFPHNDGGEEYGFHNPGVETFKGNVERYVAREILQNSLDARDRADKPVVVEFQREELPRSEIPDMDVLTEVFGLCGKYWRKDDKARKFFAEAEALASERTISVLRARDYNTTGLRGKDRDREGNWYNLVRSSGSSSKSSGEGGSFGIGKNAPFAASRMRTVLYSTLNKDGEYAFQGVARLVTHERNGATAQPTGYLGTETGSAIRRRDEIPKRFRRDEQGTELAILGYTRDSEWAKDLIYSVIENFWPAIHFGDLEVVVDATRIRKKNLPELLDEYSTAENFTGHLFYRAFTEPTSTFEETLPILKKVALHLRVGGDDLPKRVAMVRGSGMVVCQRHYRSSIPYTGVFMCRNPTGNRVLREMEPPRHDKWDPDHPEKGANKKTASEFDKYIRDCIRQLAPPQNDRVLSIPELSRYLPDDDDSPEDSFEGASQEEAAEREGFDRRARVTKIEGRKIDQARRVQPDPGQPGMDGEEGDGGAGDHEEDSNGSQNGDANVNGKGRYGGQGGRGTKPLVAIRFRAFPTDLKKGAYSIIIEAGSRKRQPAILRISAVGDDSTKAVDIAEARLPDGRKVPVRATGILGPVTLPARGSLRIDIILREPRRFALEAEAYEA